MDTTATELKNALRILIKNIKYLGFDNDLHPYRLLKGKLHYHDFSSINGVWSRNKPPKLSIIITIEQASLIKDLFTTEKYFSLINRDKELLDLISIAKEKLVNSAVNSWANNLLRAAKKAETRVRWRNADFKRYNKFQETQAKMAKTAQVIKERAEKKSAQELKKKNKLKAQQNKLIKSLNLSDEQKFVFRKLNDESISALRAIISK